jgi:trypsin
MKKHITLFIVMIFILFSSAEVYANEDLIWAIPKPESLVGDRSTNGRARLKPIPRSLSTYGPYIVGGTPTAIGEFPEYAQLWVDGLDDYYYAICGSTLITNNKILTAAHCTEDYSAQRLYVIPNFRSFDSDATFDRLIEVTQKFEHPNYNQSTPLNNDISILTLAKQVNTAKAKIYGGNNDLSGYTATAIGTGDVNNSGDGVDLLQKVNLTIVGNSVCANFYGTSNITPSMMCTEIPGSGGEGTCFGDSGGPLFVTYNNAKVQAGIVSWGNENCALPNEYDVYARTNALIEFVRQHAPGSTIILDPDDSPVGFLPSIFLQLLNNE